MDKTTEALIEALKKQVPEDKVGEISEAVAAMVDGVKDEFENEYNDKLESAYATLSKEVKEAEEIAIQGYQEAAGIITDLRNRLEAQREEFETAMKEGYEEAYGMLVEERKKNENIEVGVYEEYDSKLNNVKEYMVDKIDEFLHYKGSEIYEQAKRDIISDPRLAEQKVVLDKIVDLTAGYLSDEDAALATGSKLEKAQQVIEELKGQKRVLESKIVRMDGDNKKLNEAVDHAKKLFNEHAKKTAQSEEQTLLKEQKERAARSKGVEGKGRSHNGPVEVISEFQNERVADTDDSDNDLLESIGGVDLDKLAVLSGLKKDNR